MMSFSLVLGRAIQGTECSGAQSQRKRNLLVRCRSFVKEKVMEFGFDKPSPAQRNAFGQVSLV